MTSYTYDGLGNLLTAKDANGHTTLSTYDLAGQLLTRTRPLGEQETFTYDTLGRLETHTDFAGQVIGFAHDVADHLSEKTLPGGSVSYSFTSGGRRTQAGDDSYVYDSRDRLLEDHKANGEVLNYTYDAGGNRTSMTTSEGTTTYGYDVLDRLDSVTDASGTTTYGYDAVGNLTSTAFPNGVTTTYGYDTLNRLVQVVNTNANGLLSSYTYTLGPAGNRLQVVESGPATTSRTVTYAYDRVYRLTQETIDEPGAGSDQVIAYTYDPVGNRTTMTRAGAVTTYAYDANDRLTTETTSGGVVTSTYDGNGNLRTRGDASTTDTYQYDAENRLVAADVESGSSTGVVTYGYDVDGMRTSKTVGGVVTDFLLDKNGAHAQVVVETNGATTVTYTHGHTLLAQQSGGATRYYVGDGQLSTRQLTDEAGAVTDTYTYDAYGVQLASSGTTPNLYRYGGEQLDPNVGFYYLRARYYAPETGRFVSTDPFLGSPFDPVTLHRYLYANGNPVNLRDPSGQITTAEVLVSLAIRAVLTAAFLWSAATLIGKITGENDESKKTLRLALALTVYQYLKVQMALNLGKSHGEGEGAISSENQAVTLEGVDEGALAKDLANYCTYNGTQKTYGLIYKLRFLRFGTGAWLPPKKGEKTRKFGHVTFWMGAAIDTSGDLNDQLRFVVAMPKTIPKTAEEFADSNIFLADPWRTRYAGQNYVSVHPLNPKFPTMAARKNVVGGVVRAPDDF